MFPRNQDQLTREAAALHGQASVVGCLQVRGAGSLAHGPSFGHLEERP